MSLLEKVKSIPVGSKITIIAKGHFGNEVTEKATYMGNLRQHGYITPCNAWAAYKGEGDTPCYKIDYRPYKKHTVYTSAIDWTIKDIKVGW
ncbi:hypothetical protein [Vallitalea maricola]|uniref:Uncharacterized protein n=1 Tax=Vallitalea maricola TaxID=3074433 RepID=A0ACB5UE14_9FIRM|nr:hypothetical protein AN2V17_04020 [Vallitalea sp. AN17-2]